jgi:hypothetical protein
MSSPCCESTCLPDGGLTSCRLRGLYHFTNPHQDGRGLARHEPGGTLETSRSHRLVIVWTVSIFVAGLALLATNDEQRGKAAAVEFST